jgi:hypothetical protein
MRRLIMPALVAIILLAAGCGRSAGTAYRDGSMTRDSDRMLQSDRRPIILADPPGAMP